MKRGWRERRQEAYWRHLEAVYRRVFGSATVARARGRTRAVEPPEWAPKAQVERVREHAITTFEPGRTA